MFLSGRGQSRMLETWHTHRRMRLYRRTGWTCAHATRPSACAVDRVCMQGFPRPTFRLSRKAEAFWREFGAFASDPTPNHRRPLSLRRYSVCEQLLSPLGEPADQRFMPELTPKFRQPLIRVERRGSLSPCSRPFGRQNLVVERVPEGQGEKAAIGCRKVMLQWLACAVLHFNQLQRADETAIR